MLIRFEELRQIKDMLPHGSMQRIADELHLDVVTVKNYFGAQHFEHGVNLDAHYEQGGGGIVELKDSSIYESAIKLLNRQNVHKHSNALG